MAADFFLKTGDLLPELVADLTYGSSSQPVPLTGTTVRFIMTDKVSGEKVVDAPATIVDAAAGQVKYAWQVGDTDVASTYKCEWEVTFGDGRPQTFPNESYTEIKITQDLGGVAPA